MQYTIPISLEASQTISKKLLIATTSTNYSDIVLTMNESMKCKQFPSYYLITKHRPELENGVVKILPKYEHLLSDKLMNARMVERSENDNDYSRKKVKIKSKYYSKIKGGFGMNYDILVRKICNYDLPIDCSTFIIFDSFDGANHLENYRR